MFVQRRIPLLVSVRLCQTNERFSPEAMAARKKRRMGKRSIEGMESVPTFGSILDKHNIPYEATNRKDISSLQINIGLTCNLSCTHCHVESSPARQETLSRKSADRIIELLKVSPSIKTVDITGGAPEMHEQFRYLIENIKPLGKTITDRCNLTILLKPNYEWVIPFLKDHQVNVIASMPCYGPENVNKQRGDNVFDESIKALQLLNAAGYGKQHNLNLDLVYNPIGPFLPPPQKPLEAEYKKQLKTHFDIEFNSLYAITNMPIKRFADDLRKEDKLESYMDLLVNSFQASNMEDVMCRNIVHVDFNGMISDCDFNSALEIPTGASKNGLSIFEIPSFEYLINKPITYAKHCFGCTAGSGSSCHGVLN